MILSQKMKAIYDRQVRTNLHKGKHEFLLARPCAFKSSEELLGVLAFDITGHLVK
jgi:hypothetical protein